MQIKTVATREIRLGFRNSWTYSFLILLTIFTIAILLIQTGVSNTDGYTDVTGAMMNVTLYLLPLITLLLGGISTVTEKEDGNWELLSTYALSTSSFLFGKWIGLSIILLTIITFSFGIAGLITVIFGSGLSISSLLFFWTFSSILALVFLGISIFIGAITNNRWQTLIGAIGVWFLTIIIWPTLLISILSFVPYQWIKPILEASTLFNPAELIRIFAMIKLGAGSVFGSEYDQWVTWMSGSLGSIFFVVLIIIWITGSLSVGALLWERRDKNR